MRWEDVARSRILLEVAKMSEDYVLYVTVDGVEGEDKGDYWVKLGNS